MHQLVPDFILQQMAAGRDDGEFEAAAIFADISGFSTLADRLMVRGQHGAEVLATVMRSIWEHLTKCVYEHGGFVATIAGDAFTAIFPVSDDDNQLALLRTLAAAWSIRDRMAQVATHETRYGVLQLQIKIGLALGGVHWEIVQSRDRRHAAYYFRGTAVDMCADAEKVAAPGDVVLSSAFFESVQKHVSIVPVDSCFLLQSIPADLPLGNTFKSKPVELDLLSRFYPRDLITQEHPGEFRQVVTVFISLPTEGTLSIFMQTVFDLRERYGGLLNQLDFGDKGTKLILFWGAPVAYENDIERALNFVLDLQERTTVPINAGVTYRIAFAGFNGSNLREEYTCQGRGTSLAARFMTSAPRGEIWVDENVARIASGRFAFELKRTSEFKGFSKPQRVYSLMERKDTFERLFEREMVGRQNAFDALANFIKPIHEGLYAGTTVIWGEAGIGKSRLAHQLRSTEVMLGDKVSWFLCQADGTLRESLNPFRYWLKQYFGLSERTSVSGNKRNFNRKLDQLIAATSNNSLTAELDRTRSCLGALVGLEWPDSLYAQLDDKGRHENTFIALTVLLKAESLRRPVVLFVEDAHWLDEESQGFILRLTSEFSDGDLSKHALAILIATRPFDGLERILNRPQSSEIHLQPLPVDSLETLVSNRLAGPVSSSLLQLLSERSGGNPFFTEQIVSHLMESDLLTVDADGWKTTISTEQLTLPTDLRSLLIARLDRLSSESQKVVQTAAVLGREFDIQTLNQMLIEEDLDIPSLVAQVEQKAIWSASTDTRYLFNHALLRDAAYSMQAQSRLKELHARAVRSIEELYSEDLNIHAARLAFHADMARLVDKAIEYYLIAGAIPPASRKAVSYYDRALDLIPQAAKQKRMKTLFAKQDVLKYVGELEVQRNVLNSLVELTAELEDVFQHAEALSRLGYCYRQLGLNREEIDAYQASIAAARRSRNTAIEALSLSLMAHSSYRIGDIEQASSSADVALTAANELPDDSYRARALTNIACYYSDSGDIGNAVDLFQQIVEVCSRQKNLYGAALNYSNLGYNYVMVGQPELACASLDEALQISKTIGNRNLIAICRLNRGLAEYRLGELDRSLSSLNEAKRQLQSMGDHLGLASAHFYLGLTLEASGNFRAAIDSFEQARVLFDEACISGYMMDAVSGLARCHLAMEEFEAAQHWVDLVWQRLSDSGAQGLEFPALAYLTCMRLFEALGDTNKAKVAVDGGYQKLMKQAERIGDAAWRRSFIHNIPEHQAIWNRFRQPSFDAQQPGSTFLKGV